MVNSLGELKPLLTALVLPPSSPLLLVGVGVWLALRKSARLGAGLAAFSAGLLWLLSCNAVAVWLGAHALAQVQPLAPERLAQLRASGVQAVVVLGGGVKASAPEYGQPQPSEATAARLTYGFFVSRASGLPLAFAGGVGWGNAGHDAPSEASAAQAFAAAQGVKLRWLDGQSRDTAENAARMHEALTSAGIRRVALVTHAWHMPRSQALFEKAGFEVVAAPTGFVLPSERPLLEWLPSAHGLMASRQVLREWLALKLR
jgi:uncharacterized SAM-binding protein YcdF (DUF218 family)